MSVRIPKSVTRIEGQAFLNCTGLSSIEIPDTVTEIGAWAIGGCTSLTSISFDGTVEQWDTIALMFAWNSNIPATKVICSDGVVSLS